MSYIILRGHWFHIIILNVHAPTEDKTDDVKGNFYEELERIFNKFPKYHTQILLGDFNAKIGKEDIFKPIIGNEISNDNGLRVVNFAISKNLIVKSTMFSHRSIHKYTWTSGPMLKESLGKVFYIVSIFKPNAPLANIIEDLGKLGNILTKQALIVIVGGPGNSLDRN
jgi:hypothetical protein